MNSNYNVAGRLLDVITDVEESGTWPESVTTSNQRLFGYNLNGDITSVQGNRKITTIIEGSDDGQPNTVTHSLANVFSAYTDFDELGRVRAKRGNNGQNTGITYDRENRIKTVKDAANNTTTLAYNAHGDVISSTDALGAVTTFGYDAAGNLNAVTAPNGAVTQYVYDGLGLLRQQISPDTGTTTYSYNTYAQLSQVTRADGGGLAYSYDGQGRISQIVASRPGLANVTRTYSYDSCTLGTGKLCAVVDSTGGNMGFAYNTQGLLAAQSHQIAANSYSTAWVYDAQGRVTVEMRLASETGYPHKGYLESLDNRVDGATGSIALRTVFPNPDGSLLPGLYSRVSVPGSVAQPLLLIDETAIGTDQNQRFVLTVSPTNTVEYRPVQLGGAVDGKRIVRSGLKAGENIIVNGLMQVRPGMPVNVMTADKAKP